MCTELSTAPVFESGIWTKMKSCMSTYNNFMSTSFFAEYTEEQVRNMAHTDLGIKRATNLVKRVLGLCKLKLGDEYSLERYESALNFNAFYMSASYLHVAFPSTTTEEKALVSKMMITALEELAAAVNAAETMEEFSSAACEKFVDAIEFHMATFGKRLPISREEKILRTLAHYEDLVGRRYVRNTTFANLYQNTEEDYAAMRVKMVEGGFENEMHEIDARVARRFANRDEGTADVLVGEPAVSG
jgi:hypothetical protein